MNDLLSEMSVFVAVVRTGSFRGAAATLHMPPSTVSRRIANLEQRIGLRLLNRTTRSLAMTEPGRVYFGRAERIVAEATLAHEELDGAATEASGLIRLSAPIDYARHALLPIVARFRKRHPAVTFDLRLAPANANLVTDSVDVAVRMGPLLDSGLITRRLTGVTSAMYANADLAQEIATMGLSIDAVPAVTFLGQPWRSEQGIIERGEVAANVDSVGALVDLARIGMGVVQAADFIAEPYCRTGELVRVFPNLTFPPAPVHALTETRLLPVRTRLFIEALASNLSTQR